MMLRRPWVYLAMLVMLTGGTYALTEISACGELDSNDETYHLTANILASDADACINISGTGITLDCQMYEVEGDSQNNDIGIHITGDSATVKNCLLGDWEDCVRITSANDVKIENSSLSSADITQQFVYAITSLRGNLTNITSSSSERTIFLQNSENFTLRNVNVSKSSGTRAHRCYSVFSTTAANDHYIHDIDETNTCTLSGSDTEKPMKYYDGVFTGCPDDTEVNHGGTYSGIVFVNCNKVNLTNTQVNDGLHMYYSENFTVTHNLFRWNVRNLEVIRSDSNTFENLTFLDTGDEHIYLAYSDYNVFRNSTLYDDFTRGIYLTASDYNNFTNIHINDSRIYGVELTTTADENLFRDSFIVTDDANADCIDLNGADNTILYNNFFNCTDEIVVGAAAANEWNTSQQAGDRVFSAGTDIGGNFYANATGQGYSEYCADANTDGFCDDSLTHGADNIDYLPLSDGYGSTTTSTTTTTTVGATTTTTVPPTINECIVDVFYVAQWDAVIQNYTYAFWVNMSLTQEDYALDDAYIRWYTPPYTPNTYYSPTEDAVDGYNYLEWNSSTDYQSLYLTDLSCMVNDTEGNTANSTQLPPILSLYLNYPSYNEGDIPGGTVLLNFTINVVDVDVLGEDADNYEHLYNFTVMNSTFDVLNTTHGVRFDNNLSTGSFVYPHFYYEWADIQNNSQYTWYVNITRNGVWKRVGPFQFTTTYFEPTDIDTGGGCLTNLGYRFVNIAIDAETYSCYNLSGIGIVRTNLTNIYTEHAAQARHASKEICFNTLTNKTLDFYISGDHIQYTYPTYDGGISYDHVLTLSNFTLLNNFYTIDLKYENDSTDYYPELATSSYTATVLCNNYAPDTIDLHSLNYSNILLSTKEIPMIDFTINETHVRGYHPTSSAESFSIFNPNLNDTINEVDTYLEDYTGDFGGSYLRIVENINASLETIWQEPWYHLAVLDVDLINNTYYQFVVFTDDETRIITWRKVLDSEDIIISIRLPNYKDQVGFREDVTLGFTSSYAAGTVGLGWNVSGNNSLVNVTFTVYNYTSATSYEEEYSQTVTTPDAGTISYSVLDRNNTYYLTAKLYSTSYTDPDTIDEVVNLRVRSKTGVPFYGSLGLPTTIMGMPRDHVYVLVSFLLVSFGLLIWGPGSAGVGGIIGVIIIAATQYLGWFTTMTWRLVLFLATMAAITLLTSGRRRTV